MQSQEKKSFPKINELLTQAGLNEMEISGGDFYLKFTIYCNPDFDHMDKSHEQHVGVEQPNVGVEQPNVGVRTDNVGVESSYVGVESSYISV